VNTLLIFAATPGTTALQRLFIHLFEHDPSSTIRILLAVLLSVGAHLTIKLISLGSERMVKIVRRKEHRFRFGTQPKFVTLVRLVANAFTWTIYFVVIGLLLEECGVNLAAYLASASVIGLAISFGSQGLVQDMVIGLTLIFSDAFDVDDVVEIVGAAVVVGRVQEIGLRFIKVLNLYDQTVLIPNRTVANVSRFPHGGIYAYADVEIPPEAVQKEVIKLVTTTVRGVWQQFNAIVLAEPEVEPAREALEGGWKFLRVRFMIWPGQGTLIETTFRQQMVRALKTLDPHYADWQVPVFYRASNAE
jgi:small conductance mechanosensitive channel